MAAKKEKWGWLRHVLTFLAILIFLVGSFIIGYICWVRATATTVSRFSSGTLVFTYVLIGLGCFLLASGLIGWISSTSQNLCLNRLFLAVTVICMVTEIGGLITLNFSQIQMDDVLQHGWTEMNQESRNLIQIHLDCCGFVGPQEFAYSTLPIDESCYEAAAPEAVESSSSLPLTATTVFHQLRLKQEGCAEKLKVWFESNKVGWVTTMALIGAVQFMAAAVALFIIRRHQLNTKPRPFSRRRLRQSRTEIESDQLPSNLP